MVNARIEIRKIVKLFLSMDHRIADGVIGYRFLRREKELLESSHTSLLSGWI